jgi:pyruvate dehydrogenase E1 component alpha subunit
VGLAIKLQKNDQVCLCFFGDGASNRGTFHEALNLASLWKVPTVYVCINNQYAMTLPFRHGSSVQDISARAASYDIPGYRVDGLDVVAVYEAVGSALERARKGGGPSLIEAVTYRLRGHSMRMDRVPGGSDYRPKGEMEDWAKNKDPIKIFRKKLVELDYLTDELDKKIQAECRKEYEEAADFAMNSPEPEPEAIFEDIYA